jgi:hypothetical protein
MHASKPCAATGTQESGSLRLQALYGLIAQGRRDTSAKYALRFSAVYTDGGTDNNDRVFCERALQLDSSA